MVGATRPGKKVQNLRCAPSRTNDKQLRLNYIENKLLIHQDNDFDLILCKCPSDAERLFHTLKNFSEENNIPNLMFTGKVKLGKTDTYKMIVEKTGWDKNKVYRRVTRT